MIPILSRMWSLITGSKFIWKLIRNWAVLSDSMHAIENTLSNMQKDGRYVPNREESSILLMALSNILKTEIIDMPGVDEYQISLEIDQINSNFQLSIKDSKSEKFLKIPVITKE